MGVIPVGDIYKSLTFDGQTSKSFNVYITGEGVFNAPERDVEMITIPGRNGAYALDNGRFENIQVTYPASIVADNETDFATAVSDFRNFLCSRSGYCRLTDEYNPNEYRMAIYKSGLEVDSKILRAGEFNITFECKPQRWLTSGESPTTVSNNGTLTNPTYFESSPLLASLGYGNIAFNGFEVEIENVPIGDVTLYNGSTAYVSVITLDETNINVGDTISISKVIQHLYIRDDVQQNYGYLNRLTSTVTDSNSSASTIYVRQQKLNTYASRFEFDTTFEGFDIIAGTSSDVINTVSGTISTRDQKQSKNAAITFSCDQKIAYNASTHKITMSIYNNIATANQTWVACMVGSLGFNMGNIIGHSTKSSVSDTVYIDCDIGECWTVQGGEIISLNGVITLGSDLPTLAPGSNTFTFDNTITQLDVTPRWWKV